ncbi:MAG: 2-C-methyl-D-erythritol 2,4-cyclodiphosphate synthase [Atopobiaceae bacterium]|jgi:2-C-methyl-D-erythritol 2,4-cyclodiphosphate synthase
MAHTCSDASLHIGHGYDVHQLVPGRKLILGGVEIQHTLGLDGHSDADVLAHALSDALLSAARQPDIGQLFPDSDPAYEGADSLMLLAQVGELLHREGYEILDCDCTVGAQAPKLAPYKDRMRANLARALTVDPGRVGLSATTTEHLGFVGREEGIEAWAVVLIARICTS